MNPATGQVEVTHVGTNSFTTAGSLPFCHLFNYGTTIPPGTSFGPGESKVFTVGGLNSSASDLWLYRDGNFASPTSIITGLKYGSSASIGRTSVAVAAGIWPSTSAFVPTPQSGLAAQPFTIADTRTTNWFAGTPNFGSFSAAQIEITGLAKSDTNFVLEFSSSFPFASHRLESRSTFEPAASWTESSLTASNRAPGVFEFRIPQSTNGSEFFRVKSIP
ncbi:MAG: hypothetical protein L0Y58_23240 [Verrucomicrobia subdivision 3 bacterium]|nr:hypothetical protein [Limisphaerales bacterium]